MSQISWKSGFVFGRSEVQILSPYTFPDVSLFYKVPLSKLCNHVLKQTTSSSFQIHPNSSLTWTDYTSGVRFSKVTVIISVLIPCGNGNPVPGVKRPVLKASHSLLCVLFSGKLGKFNPVFTRISGVVFIQRATFSSYLLLNPQKSKLV